MLKVSDVYSEMDFLKNDAEGIGCSTTHGRNHQDIITKSAIFCALCYNKQVLLPVI